VCLTVDMDINSLMRRHCAGVDLPLYCLPIYLPASLVFTFVATHGPWSMVLFPLRLIYNFLVHREEDAILFAMKLCILVTIECLLFIFCEYHDERFNDSTKSVLDDKGGAKVAKYTITILRDTVIPVAKSVLCATTLFVLGIFAYLILLETVTRALRLIRRRPVWFQGRMHLD
jgi:hypothetical protein